MALKMINEASSIRKLVGLMVQDPGNKTFFSEMEYRFKGLSTAASPTVRLQA
jgi:hypothetical protein